MCLIVSNKVEFMAHCELTQEVGHEHHCIDIGVNHAVDHRGTKYSTMQYSTTALWEWGFQLKTHWRKYLRGTDLMIFMVFHCPGIAKCASM